MGGAYPQRTFVISKNKHNNMAQLIKSYPNQQHKNKIVCGGSLQEMKAQLDQIEARIRREQLSTCGSIFTELARIDDLTLNTCICKNIGTGDVETMDVNYCVFP
jgi:hypothetical protein